MLQIYKINFTRKCEFIISNSTSFFDVPNYMRDLNSTLMVAEGSIGSSSS